MVDEDRTPEECLEASLSAKERIRLRKNEESRRWREANREKHRQAVRNWRAKNLEKSREYSRKWIEENKCKKQSYDRIYNKTCRDKADKAKRQREYYQLNKEEILERVAERRKAAPEKVRAANQRYVEKYPEKVKEYQEKRKPGRNTHRIRRYREDSRYKIEITLRSRLNRALKAQEARKCNSTIELIGCSIEELKAHLEAQFQPGMTWENYGYWGWHVDHAHPIAAHDLTDPDQQRVAFHFTNLQPLWREDNQKKSARLDWKPE